MSAGIQGEYLNALRKERVCELADRNMALRILVNLQQSKRHYMARKAVPLHGGKIPRSPWKNHWDLHIA
jgi:hypothetical protein